MVNKTIGRFSALACVDMVHITSYYEGTQYQYVMLKNGTKINIDLIDSRPTTEHNGVEVKITVKPINIRSYIYALKYLWFIPNIYIHYISPSYDKNNYNKLIDEFNERKIGYFNNFVYNNISTYDITDEDMFILLGDILYPIDCKHVFNDITSSRLDDIRYIWSKVIPKFNIGELDVTPNREQLLYSNKTKKALQEKYKKCTEELIDLTKKETSKVFDDIFKYYKAQYSSNIYKDIIFKTCVCYNCSTLEVSFHLNYQTFLFPFVKYKYNNSLADDKDIQQTMIDLTASHTRYFCNAFTNMAVFEDDKLYTNKQLKGYSIIRNKSFKYFNMSDFITNKNNQINIVYIPNMNGIKSNLFKEYFIEKYSNKTDRYNRKLYIFTSDIPSARKFINKDGFHVCVHGDLNQVDWHKSLWLLREVCRNINCSITVSDILKSADFLEYKTNKLNKEKEERKCNAIYKRFNKQIRFYCQYYIDDYSRACNSTIDVYDIKELISKVSTETRRYIGKLTPVYWTIRETPHEQFWKNLYHEEQAFVLITVANTNVKYLERYQLPKHWHQLTTEFISNHRYFRRLITCHDKAVDPKKFTTTLLQNSLDYKTFHEIMHTISYRIQSRSNENSDLFNTLKTNFNGYYDQKMLANYNIINKYNQISDSITPLVALNENLLTNFVLYVAIKKHLFRPTLNLYKQLKECINFKNFNNEKTN